jgi:hypothetical protein
MRGVSRGKRSKGVTMQMAEWRKLPKWPRHVRPYGANHQWVKVPHQEFSVCLDS